jgi:hypothetical protein
MLDYNVEVKKGKAIGIINHEDKWISNFKSFKKTNFIFKWIVKM